MMTENGPRQVALLARMGVTGVIIPNGNAERCAAWRLVRRGVLAKYRMGGPGFGYLTIYKVVAR